MAKSLESMMEGLVSPEGIELNTKYQNARDAVSWGYRFAQERLVGASVAGGYSQAVVALARELIPKIEYDLNLTLHVLGTK